MKKLSCLTGGSPLTHDFTTEEELFLDLNNGRPVRKTIQGGAFTESEPTRETILFAEVLPLHMEDNHIF